MSSPTRQRYPRDELLARFHQAVDMVVRTLEAQDDDVVRDLRSRTSRRSRLGWDCFWSVPPT